MTVFHITLAILLAAILGSALAHRFHLPLELTLVVGSLLVALIPGPVKYQRSLASGHPSPGFRPLVDGLLAKLRSVNALSEEEYEAARADELGVRTDPSQSVGADPGEPDETTPTDEPPP
jgi:membrane peptidoglycan carboxypeptidase